MAETGVKREPFRKILSENVEVLYGWKDSHAVVRGRLPILLKPWYPLTLTVKDLQVFKQTFMGALEFGDGKSSLALVDPIQIEVREDCRVRWGYKDRHLELDLERFRIWLKFEFTFEELKLGKKALDEACAWADLPQDVRNLQGL